MPKKIALVGFDMGSGGAPRVQSALSFFFHSKGFDVHHIIIHDNIKYPFAGKMYNNGKLKSKSNTLLNKINRFYALWKYFKKEQFDYVVDFRFRKVILQEWMISKFIYPQNSIYTIHSSLFEIYLPKSQFWANKIYGNKHRLITVSKALNSRITSYYPKITEIQSVYNPVQLEDIEQDSKASFDLGFKYILAAGRMDDGTKQIDKLIKAYSQSALPKNNIHLVVLGEGSLKDSYKEIVKTMNMETKIHFEGNQPNPFVYMCHAICFVLCSIWEGLPMVLIESLACGTPVVAFDCPTGPSEIIQPNKNGILVKNQDFAELFQSITSLISDKELYQTCKQNAKESLAPFKLETIGNQWLKIFKSVDQQQ